MKKPIFLSIYLLWMALALFPIQNPANAQTGNEQNDPVTYYLLTEQTAKAKSILLTELSKNDIQAERAYHLGKLYLDEQKKDSALLAFNKMNVQNEEQRLLQLAGHMLIELTKRKNADINLRILREIKAINLSKSAKVKLEMALILAQINESATAWELIEQACSMKSSDAATFTAAGDIYVRLSHILNEPGLYGKGCGRYEQAIYSNKNFLPARTSLAQAYYNSRNYFEARTLLTETLAIDSTWIPAQRLMGEVHYALGNYKPASFYYTKFIGQINPDRAQLQKYAYILYFNQEYQKAKDIISNLMVNEPANAVLLRLYAYTSAETKASKEGLKAIREFMNLRKAEDTLKLISTDYEYFGRLLSMELQDSLAVIQYEKAIQLDSTNISLFENIAKSFEKIKNYEQAISYYTKALKANPQSPSTMWFARGRNCLLLAEKPEIAVDSVKKTELLNLAIDSFNKVIELSPVSHLGYVWKGRAFAALDPETIQGLAEESYLHSINILEAKQTPDKFKTELNEAYRYMGYLNYLRFDQAIKNKKSDASGFKDQSIEYWNRILLLDPSNQIASQGLKALK